MSKYPDITVKLSKNPNWQKDKDAVENILFPNGAKDESEERYLFYKGLLKCNAQNGNLRDYLKTWVNII